MSSNSDLTETTETEHLPHATYITEQNGVFVVIHGHGGPEVEDYDLKIVSNPRGFDSAGAPVPLSLVAQDKVMALDGTDGAAVLTLDYVDGWWTEDAAGAWHNAAPEGFDGFKFSGHYAAYPVAYVGATDAPGHAFGHPLEIVPQTDPFTLAKGDSLAVQVLKDGQPLAGVALNVDILTGWDRLTAETDARGMTLVQVQTTGMNVVQLYHQVELAEKVSQGHQAVLSFIAGG